MTDHRNRISDDWIDFQQTLFPFGRSVPLETCCGKCKAKNRPRFRWSRNLAV